MKKYLLVLGMIVCLFGLTACSSEKESIEPLMTTEEAADNAQKLISLLVQSAEQGIPDELKGYPNYSVLEDAVESFNKAKKDMGDYVEIIDSEVVTLGEEEAVINVTIKGTDRNAVVEVIYEESDSMGYMLTSMSTNVTYTFGESMQRAGLNTLLGMGTVFVMLIFISLIISCFRFISVFENSKKKEGPKAEEAEQASVREAESVQTVEEDLTDDLELVAVIAAAIAASEGAANTDGFVVRSIRKANKSKWQNA